MSSQADASRPVVTRTLFGLVGGMLLSALVACDNRDAPSAETLERGSIPYTRIESIRIDGRELTVTFTGSAAYDPDNPCSAAYQLEVNENAAPLEIGVWAVPHPLRGPDVGCTLLGHFREETTRLASTYNGTTIWDLAGYLRHLQPPDTLPVLQPADGWVEAASTDMPFEPNGGWQVTYQQGVWVAWSTTHPLHRPHWILPFVGTENPVVGADGLEPPTSSL